MQYNIGSVWRKWDLHVHTPASHGWKGERFNPEDLPRTRQLLADLVETINATDIAVFGIQDYWTFDGYKTIRKYLAEEGALACRKTILPGIELRIEAPVSFRVNIHVMFSDSVSDERLDIFKHSLRIGGDRRLTTEGLLDFARNLDDGKLAVHGLAPPDRENDAKMLQLGYDTAKVTFESFRSALEEFRSTEYLVVQPYDTHGGIERLNWKTHPHDDAKFFSYAEPVLRALGWNVEDLEEVQREYKTKRRDRPVDYALLLLRTPRLFIEAKALGEHLSDRKWVNQIMGYAAVAGVEWIALTDGDEYRLYNAHAAVSADEKLFRVFRISEVNPQVEETLLLIARERMEENRLEVLWKAHFVDRQVSRAIDEMFESEADESLVRLLRRRIGALSPAEIRASLKRAHVQVEFPVANELSKMPKARGRVPPTTSRKGARPAPRHVGVSVQDLIRAGLITAPLSLETTYKGHALSARVEADGRVTWGKKTFDSLSTAAAHARASIKGLKPDGKPPQTNGWTFWKCSQPDGTLAEIDVLRQTHLKRSSMRRVE
jgi:hypothetical protein